MTEHENICNYCNHFNVGTSTCDRVENEDTCLIDLVCGEDSVENRIKNKEMRSRRRALTKVHNKRIKRELRACASKYNPCIWYDKEKNRVLRCKYPAKKYYKKLSNRHFRRAAADEIGNYSIYKKQNSVFKNVWF